MKPWKKNLLVTFAIIVLIVWAIQFFIYSVGAIIHSLLVISAIMLFIRFRRWKKTRKETRRPGSRRDIDPPRNSY